MATTKGWTRKLKRSGPADTYLDRYQIQGSPPEYNVVDLIGNLRLNRRPFRMMRDARDFIEHQCGPQI